MPLRSEGFLPGYLPYLLRQADQVLSAPFYDVLSVNGVARSEWRVLAVLEELGELSVLELTAAALSPQPTVTHALGRLEKRGLVVRAPGIRDKRQRIVSVTSSGSTLTKRLIEEATRLADAALSEVGDLSELIVQLQDLTATIEAHHGRLGDETSADPAPGRIA